MIKILTGGSHCPMIYIDGQRVRRSDVDFSCDKIEIFAIDYADCDDFRDIAMDAFYDRLELKLRAEKVRVFGLSYVSLLRNGCKFIVGFACSIGLKEWKYPWALNSYVDRLHSICTSGKYRNVTFIDESDEDGPHYYYSIKFTGNAIGTIGNFLESKILTMQQIHKSACSDLALLVQKRVVD